jgi:hypothetical protein
MAIENFLLSRGVGTERLSFLCLSIYGDTSAGVGGLLDLDLQTT